MFRALCLISLIAVAPVRAVEIELEYAPAPADNPLKGLVPYAGDWGEDAFPHSMEFFYVPVSGLVVGEGKYDWAPLEAMLEPVARRGHQSVLRLYLEYPKKETGVPEYLRDEALDKDGLPDYSNARLQGCVTDLIAAFGAKFDGAARIGFITAGLLGKWGEWHTWPEDERWASKGFQKAVLEAYAKAFKTTPVLLRYPAGDGDARNVANADLPFGYHDDSFAWGTLGTGDPAHFWYFTAMLESSGDAALNKWKTQPIGGEIRPEAWGQCFDPKPANPKVQDFGKCVETTHVSWLMDSGMFKKEHRTPERTERAKAAVRRMGYEFFVSKARLDWEGDALTVSIDVENRGVAPFYYPSWKIEWGVLDDGGKVVRSKRSDVGLAGILPGASRQGVAVLGVDPNSRWVAIRVQNVMPGGASLRFANKTQDAHADGWLTLGETPGS